MLDSFCFMFARKDLWISVCVTKTHCISISTFNWKLFMRTHVYCYWTDVKGFCKNWSSLNRRICLNSANLFYIFKSYKHGWILFTVKKGVLRQQFWLNMMESFSRLRGLQLKLPRAAPRCSIQCSLSALSLLSRAPSCSLRAPSRAALLPFLTENGNPKY